MSKIDEKDQKCCQSVDCDGVETCDCQGLCTCEQEINFDDVDDCGISCCNDGDDDDDDDDQECDESDIDCEL